MSVKGGYMVLDFSQYDLTSGSATKITGIYERLEGNYGKPILISGLTVGRTTYNDFYCNLLSTGSAFNGTSETIEINIAANDNVTVTIS